MNFTQSFRLAIKSLRTSKMRAFLTMLGIVIGVGAVIVIISLGNGLQQMVDQQVENMGVNLIQTMIYGRGDGTTMNLDPDEMYQLVEEHPDVLSGVSPYVSTNAPLRSGDTLYERTSIYGVSEIMYKQDTHATLDGETWPRGGSFSISMWSAPRMCAWSGPFWRRTHLTATPWARPSRLAACPTPWWGC